MRIRSLAVAGLVASAVMLSGCTPADPEPAPVPSGSDEPSVEPTETVGVPAELVLPDDALLGLVGIIAAPNGATADFAVVVRASLPYMVPEAADAVAATVAWCTGEVDQTVIAGRGFTFTTVEVSISPREGDWPADEPLLVLPVVNPEYGSTLATGGGLRQVEAATDDVFTDYVPHCQQPALLDGAGDGILYLGIPQDIGGANESASFTAWMLHDFGLTATLPGEFGASEIKFTACSAALTPLAEEFGALTDDWSEKFTPTGCSVGGFPAG